MIEKLFQHQHILHQTADSDMDVPDAPIAGGIDNANMIILSQEGRYLCVNRASVPELCKLLKLLRLLRRSDDQAQKKTRPVCEPVDEPGAEEGEVSLRLARSGYSFGLGFFSVIVESSAAIDTQRGQMVFTSGGVSCSINPESGHPRHEESQCH
jgi:hypothetical protein